MYLIVIKYVQLFCLTVFVTNNINCDQLLLHSETEDRQLYYVVSCTASCMKSSNNSILENCYKGCLSESTQNILEPLKNVSESFSVNLLCRDSNSLELEIYLDSKTEINQTNNDINASRKEIRRSKTKPQAKLGMLTEMEGVIRNKSDKWEKCLYLLKIQEMDNAQTERTVYLSDSHLLTLNNLKPGKLYNITGTVLNTHHEYAYINQIYQFSTLESDFKPKNITDIRVQKFNTNLYRQDLLDAEIVWYPALDKVCNFVVVYTVEINLNSYQYNKNQPAKYYEGTIKALKFGTSFKVAVRAKNTNNRSLESGLVFTQFNVPTCLEWYDNDLDKCAPMIPELIHSTEEMVDNHIYNINVTWKNPKLKPNYYIVKILDLHSSEKKPYLFTKNISGEATSAILELVQVLGVHYEVVLTAVTAGGNSTANILSSAPKKNVIIKEKSSVLKIVFFVFTPIVILALSTLLILVICHRRAKLRRYEERCRYFEELEQKAPIDPNSNFDLKTKNLSNLMQLMTLQNQFDSINDKMEILRDRINLLEVLGEGAFGLVRKGTIRMENGEEKLVAVKTLKDCPNVDEIKEFRREIEVMKSVGEHPNIVCIIGHCTNNIKEIMLLTEYCSKGNLLNFLRAEWQRLLKVHTLNTDGKSLLSNRKSNENIFNFDRPVEKAFINYKNLNNPPPISHYEKIPDSDELSSGEINPLTQLKDESIFNDNEIIKNFNKNLCTSACRCTVEIPLPPSEVDDDNNSNKENNISNPNKLIIKDCDCHKEFFMSDLDRYYDRTTVINAVENKSYVQMLDSEDLMDTNNSPGTTPDFKVHKYLTSRDLLLIAKQIAIGMDFLARNKVVHRDLAARNVLVCDGNVVKISDFGLSRDIYQQNMYKKTGNGKLPIKWLAIESLTHQIYTSQSDVWSYGILLYEIVTLGSNPYPSIPANQLLKLLKTGYRMEKPINCSQEMHDVMMSCWSANPSERPAFFDIIEKLNTFLMNMTNERIIDLNAIEYDQKMTSSATGQSYMKPI